MSDPTIIHDVISNLPAILTSLCVGGASVFTMIKTNRETCKMQKRQLLKINQLLLHDEHLPDSERINAGEEYVEVIYKV
jgi:hypothetical protein